MSQPTPSAGPPPLRWTLADLFALIAATALLSVASRGVGEGDWSVGEGAILLLVLVIGAFTLLGPWMLWHQFRSPSREDLWAGEWLWCVLAAAWLVVIVRRFFWGAPGATPSQWMAMGSGGPALAFFVVVEFFALAAVVHGLSLRLPRPWTHWAGILIAALHGIPLLVLADPALASRVLYGLIG